MFSLKGKIVVVTGACGQLGTEIIKSVIQTEGVPVGLDVSVNNNRCEGVAYHQIDITKPHDVDKLIASLFRERPIDVFVNNAGVSTFEPFENRPEESFDRVMDVNLKGTFNCIKSYVNAYDGVGSKKGSIINIGSVYGTISPDFRIYTDCARNNSEVYGATKAGVVQMTKYFSVHLAGRGIRVNAVSPGGIYNPENPQGADFVENYSYRCPMKRMANAEEIVGAILYFASDMSSYTTGQNLLVDGGFSAW